MDAPEIGDVKIGAREIEGDRIRPAALGLFSQTGIREACTRIGLEIDLSHAAVPCIADEDVAVGQHGEIVRTVELRLERGAAITAAADFARAGDVGEDAFAVDLQQAISRSPSR